MSLYDPIEVVTTELQAHGVTEWTIDRSNNHPKIRFEFNGNQIMFVVPSSPSDRHGWQNSLTDLRKRMGVRRLVTKSASPKRKRNQTEAKVSLTDLSFSVRPDPFTSLAVVADRMKAEIADAWQRGEHALLGGGSGAAPQTWPIHLSQAYVAGWWAMHALVHEVVG